MVDLTRISCRRTVARTMTGLLFLATAMTCGITGSHAGSVSHSLDQIQTVVVIFAENRSFDNLYNGFPGADTFAGC
ncbi:hypothetical protein [Komagataeibacter diospyri]|uniref:hypothetical protein n=1 Tax=Komagataeibacter diospyri TaxID=1932662 RepID=UPI00375831A4